MSDIAAKIKFRRDDESCRVQAWHESVTQADVSPSQPSDPGVTLNTRIPDLVAGKGPVEVMVIDSVRKPAVN